MGCYEINAFLRRYCPDLAFASSEAENHQRLESSFPENTSLAFMELDFCMSNFRSRSYTQKQLLLKCPGDIWWFSLNSRHHLRNVIADRFPVCLLFLWHGKKMFQSDCPQEITDVQLLGNAIKTDLITKILVSISDSSQFSALWWSSVLSFHVCVKAGCLRKNKNASKTYCTSALNAVEI